MNTFDHDFANVPAMLRFVDAETATSLWEAMLDCRDRIPALDAEWKLRGTVHMRLLAVTYAPAINAAWEALDDDTRDALAPFDWEYLPRVVAKIDWPYISATDVTAAAEAAARPNSMTTEAHKPIDRLEFESPINMEGSWGASNVAKKAKSTMAFYLNRDNTGWIEWEVEELDLFEEIGLTFDIAPDGKRTLTDYDGVMTLPDQAMDLMERNGIDCVEMRKAMED